MANNFLKNNLCQTCSEWKGTNCLACTDANTCTSCASGSTLSAGSCSGCDTSCGTCDAGGCLTCVNGTLLLKN